MATITAAWTENVSVQAAQTLAANYSDVDDIDIAAAGYDKIVLQFSVTFHASATEGYTIEIFNSSNSGTTEDNIPIITQNISVAAGLIKTLSIPIEGLPYIAVYRKNEDGSYDITNETITYAGRKWSSA